MTVKQYQEMRERAKVTLPPVEPFLNIVTIVYNAMPWLACHLPTLNQLTIPWQWSIAEGAAANVNCTSWCRPQQPGLSSDGTTEFLSALANHPRISVVQKEWWAGGKVEQINAAVKQLRQGGVLLQLDADEIYSAGQLRDIVALFQINKKAERAAFECRYYVGPHLVVTNDASNYWLRAWRFSPGMTFQSHEPPVFNRNSGEEIPAQVTAKMGIIFQHMSWVLDKQTSYKVNFYGYGNSGFLGWKRLQKHQTFPTMLKPFMHWCKEGNLVERV